jgi:hypothetical protein
MPLEIPSTENHVSHRELQNFGILTVQPAGFGAEDTGQQTRLVFFLPHPISAIDMKPALQF